MTCCLLLLHDFPTQLLQIQYEVCLFYREIRGRPRRQKVFLVMNSQLGFLLLSLLVIVVSLAGPQDVSGDETSRSSHSRIIYRSSRAPAPIGPYNQAVRVDDVLYISGQIGLSPETGEMPDSVEDQTFQTLNNMAQILEVRLRINVLQHNS